MAQFPDEMAPFPSKGREAHGWSGHSPKQRGVDAGSGWVIMTSDARPLGRHQRIADMADPLHFGTFGGYWTRVPWCLFGLLLTGLALSSAAIYSHRITHGAGTQPANPIREGMWRGMGRGTPQF